MKKIQFIKNKQGEVEVKTVNDVGLCANGSAIHVKMGLLNEALKNDLFEKRRYGRSQNVFYKCGDMTLVKIKGEEVNSNKNEKKEAYLRDEVIILDSNIVYKAENDKTVEVWVGDLLNNKAIFAVKSGTRRLFRLNVQKVQHINRKKQVVIDDNHPVEVAAVLRQVVDNQLYENRNRAFNFDIVGMEVHHAGYDWDNRLCVAQYWTAEQHKAYHSENGKESHQCYVTISDLDQLKAFLKYIENSSTAKLK